MKHRTVLITTVLVMSMIGQNIAFQRININDRNRHVIITKFGLISEDPDPIIYIKKKQQNKEKEQMKENKEKQHNKQKEHSKGKQQNNNKK